MVALFALSACSGTVPPATGGLSLSVTYIAPPPGAPMSMGGYAAFARLTGPDGGAIYDGEINPWTSAGEARDSAQLFELLAGDYELSVTVRSASDAIEVDQNGNIHRDFGPVTATCAATARISPPDLTAVVVTVAGGTSCSISAAG